MRVGIISERALTTKHGTGAQLLRLFSGANVEFFHLYFQLGHGDTSDCGNSYKLVDERPTWTSRRGLRRIHKVLVPGWWGFDFELRQKTFLRFKRDNDLVCDVAYVLAGSELAAKQCVSLLSCLNCPYVVHIMDIYHDELEPSSMRGFQALLGQSKSAIGTTPAICDQIAKFGLKDIRNIFIGQESNVVQASPPATQQKVQVIMSGRPYQGGVDLLEKTLPVIAARYPQVSFVYAGAYFDDHPPVCQRLIRNYGHIQDAATYTKLMGESHLAYLTGPSELDVFGRYSFPSRTSDYLMAGLPLIGCVADGTATQQILQPLVPDAVRWAYTPEQMLAAFDHYLGSSSAWCSASRKGRAFALNTMSIDVVRQQVFDALEQAYRNHI